LEDIELDALSLTLIYKPIHAREVAKAMLAVSKQNKGGFFIYHYKEIMELIRPFE